MNIGPSESSKTITLNPETNEIFLDVNTASVIPRAPAAGYSSGSWDMIDSVSYISHVAGSGTGQFNLELLDPRALEDTNTFQITFNTSPVRYSIEDLKPVIENRIIKKDIYVTLLNNRLNPDRFEMKLNGEVMTVGSDYSLFAESGQIVVPSTFSSRINDGDQVEISYTSYPLWESKLLNLEESNPVVDGLKLYAKQDPLRLNKDKTKWQIGSNANYKINVKPYNSDPDNMRPSDYEIRWFDAIADTSAIGGATAPFQIWDVTPGRLPFKKDFAVLDYKIRNQTWDIEEEVVLLEPGEGLNISWQFSILPADNATTVEHKSGDIFYIATDRPFDENDIYQYKTIASKVNEEKATNELDQIRVVPNPYVVTNVLEPLDRQNPRDRGPRRIYFDKLPATCKIKIYTLTGELVKEIDHESAFDNGQEFWDLTTKDNFPIAYGVYVYHIDAGKIGEKIGRLAIIK
tara:strand:+ start:1 stop:1383 length:1383 start_codon:yes stop_codon:yes gene_type:complete